MIDWPEPPSEGVYYIKEIDEIILVDRAASFYFLEVYYKARQRKPKMITPNVLDGMIYIGEFE